MHLIVMIGLCLILLGVQNNLSGTVFAGGFLVFVGLTLTIYFLFEDKIVRAFNNLKNGN